MFVQELRNYDQIIRQMRLEIESLKRRTAELQALTVSSDDELQKQCTQLIDKVIMQ